MAVPKKKKSLIEEPRDTRLKYSKDVTKKVERRKDRETLRHWEPPDEEEGEGG